MRRWRLEAGLLEATASPVLDRVEFNISAYHTLYVPPVAPGSLVLSPAASVGGKETVLSALEHPSKC